MRRRLAALLVAAAAGAALGVLPALAANPTVHARDDLTFGPATVTVAPGETVTWVNDGGNHNVHFDGEALGTPAAPSRTWSEPVTRTFGKEGTYRYYCDPHEDAGMVGTVVVKAPPTTGTTTAPSDPTPAPTPAPTAAPDPGSTEATTLSARPLEGPFCARRSRTCRRPGARLRLAVQPAGDLARFTVEVLRRKPGATRYTRFGSLSLALAAGTHTVRVGRTNAGRRLTAGRYRLVFREPSMARPVTVAFRLSP